MSQGKSNQIYDRAEEALWRQDYRTAMDLAEQLLRRSFTGGYEIKARALAGLGKQAEAIEVLRQGVAVAPAVAILWSYLGEYLSNSGQYEDALSAFHEAGNAGHEFSVSRMNIAIVYNRMGRNDLALKFIDDAKGSASHEFSRLATRAHILCDLEEFEGALLDAESSIRLKRDAYALGTSARALLALGRPTEARARAWESVLDDAGTASALAVLRSFHEASTESTNVFDIQIDATLPAGFLLKTGVPATGAISTYRVAADDAEEALALVREFEADAVSIEIADLERLDEIPTGNKGVLNASRRHTFYFTSDSRWKRGVAWIRAILSGGRLSRDSAQSKPDKEAT